MRSDLLEHELTKTAGVFGRRDEVQVVFHGDQAMTDGSTVVLPVMTSGAEVEQTTAMVLRGYVDHEAGHVRHTDFAALRKFKEECAALGNKLAPALHNALEDIWLERRVLRDYPGALKNLRETATAVDREFLKMAAEQPSHPGLSDEKFLAAVAITWEGRREYGHTTGHECLALVPEALRRKLPLWVDALDACETTQDVIDLARMVDWELAEPPPEKEEEKSEEGSGPSKTVEAGEGGREASGASEAGGEEVSDESSGSGEGSIEEEDATKCEAGGGKGARGTRKPRSAEAEPFTEFDMKRVVEKAMKGAGLLEGGSDAYRPWTKRYDKWHHRTDAEDKYGHHTYGRVLAAGTGTAYEKLKATHLTGSVNVMRRKLERAILSQQRRDWQGGYEAGRLDTRALVRAVRGDASVFKMREDERSVDTAITVLVDMSGSMSSGSGHMSKGMMAQLVAMALTEALDRTGARYEVLGFNAASGAIDWSKRLRDDPPASFKGRHEPVDMYEFKRFEESLYQAKGAMTKIASLVTGNNVDGESVLYAYHRLAARSERRKILLTLSDGEPAFYHGYTTPLPEQHLRDVIDFIGRRGVDCVGIGIQTGAVKRFYPRWAVVNRLEDLAGQTIEMLAKLLINERYVADNSKLMSVGGTMR
jgi:cobalamin biosynthesis protein CobT